MAKRNRSKNAGRAPEIVANDAAAVDSDSATVPNDAPADVIIPVTWRTIAVLSFLIFTPWLLFAAGAIFSRERPLVASALTERSPSTSAAGKSLQPTSSDKQLEPPPEWGKLTQTRIMISPPAEFIEELDVSRVGTSWHFSNAWSGKLDELLADFGIEKSIRKELTAMSESSLDEVIPVTNELLQKIPLETRAKVYDYLATDPRNADQYNAFRYCGDSVDEWFQNSKLRPELVERIKSMVYSRGPVFFFADLRLVLPEAVNERERIQLLKVLSRESTRLVRLRVNKGSNIENLVDYWGRFGRAKDVRPILESLSLRFKGGDIDIVHLLPPFARERIYTYPGTANGNLVANRNSHWTALNFFGDQPDDGYTSITQVGETLQSDYYPILGAPQFGDLVCLTDQNGDLFHTAVYLADDLLYTKNGQRVSRPWMLLSMDEMMHFYPRREPTNVRFFRRKDS